MARPRYTGNGYSNPINSLGLHAESRNRASAPIGRQFMSNETKVFNALGSALLKLIKEMAEKAGKEAFQKALKEGLTEAQAKAMQEATQKAVKEMAEEAAEKALKEGGQEAAEKAAKAAVKEATEESFEKIGKEVSEKTTKELAEESSEQLAKESSEGFLKKAGKTTAKAGAIGAGVALGAGVFALAGIFGMSALQDFMEDFSGLNCDEKADDAGLDEGTEKYTEYVEECQDKAATRMMILGVTGIVVLGGVVFLLFK